MIGSMGRAADRCLEENTLDALGRGQLSPLEREAAARHLDACEACRQVLAALGHAMTSVEAAATSVEGAASAEAAATPGEAGTSRGERAGPEAVQPPLAAGSRIHRYTVLHLVGAGGMGVVYAAYDPELDRRVALKLVHHGILPSGSREEAVSRLLREAQALARLSHPQVVTVFDVGRFDGQVFLAMEFVEGGTLGQWLRAERRAPHAALEMFLQAGRGLAAAHAAGLVHRDFKPDNVLVGKDGRARVTDFGLARVVTPGEQASEGGEGAPRALPASLGANTQPGALLGTPAYMAPELWRGASADERSDQFAFCVALHEALQGERPFSAASLAGSPDRPAELPPPRADRIPPPLSRPLLRGLAARPEDRFPTMTALLVALERGRASPRRRLWTFGALVGTAAVLAAGIGVARWRDRDQGLCGHAGDRLAGVWDEARRSEVRAALLATKVPYAQAAWSRTEQLLDRYAAGWVEVHTESCEATHVRGEQSGELLDLRMACLSQHRQRLRALTSLLAAADAGVVENAVKAAEQLPPLDECEPSKVLASPLRAPEDPAARAQIEAVRAALAEAEAALDAGRYEASRASARRAVDGAKAIAYRPLEAEAFLALARVHVRSEEGAPAAQALHRALAAAQASGHVRVAAQALVSLAHVDGLMLRQHPQAHVWADLSEATMERVEDAPLLTAERLDVLGNLLRDEGRAGEAIPYLERALSLRERALGAEHAVVARTLSRLAWALSMLERSPEALALAQRSLAIYERLLGPDHPECSRALHTIAFILAQAGRKPEAIPLMERALAIEERVFGPDHPGLVKSLVNLSNVQSEPRAAIPLLERALALQERAALGEHPDTAFVLKNLAVAGGLLKRHAEQLAHAQRTLRIEEKLLEPNHPDLAVTLFMIGQAHHGLGEPERGLPFLERAMAVAESRPVTDSYATARDVRVVIRRELADTLWALGRDRARARTVAEGALDLARAGGDLLAREAAEVEAWLSAHAPSRGGHAPSRGGGHRASGTAAP